MSPPQGEHGPTLAEAASASAGYGVPGTRYVTEFREAIDAQLDADKRASMLSDEPEPTGKPEFDAYFAALAEHLAFRHGVPPPAWVNAPQRFLRRPYFPRGHDAFKAYLLARSPRAFRRRMVFVSEAPADGVGKEIAARLGGTPARAPLVELMKALAVLDEAFAGLGVILDVAVHDGLAVATAFDVRETILDVDQVIGGGAPMAQKALAIIARDSMWPPDWLLGGIRRTLVEDEQARFLAYDGSTRGGMRIHYTSPEYLLAMRCLAPADTGSELSGRVQDLPVLLDAAHVRSVSDALALLEPFYPESALPPATRANVEAMLQQAL